MKWTTPAALKAQVQKLWNRGLLLASLAGGEPVFPRRLTLKGPATRELSERFPEVRAWIAKLSAAAGRYRIEWRSVNHRVLGTNEIPAAVWVDTLEDALGLIGKRKAAEQFTALLETTREQQPKLIPWLAKRPLRALELADDWSQLLSIVAWLQKHPRPTIYLRQIDLPGVHSKLIEGHRAVLAELFDLALPLTAIEATHTGAGGFCRRYGFLDKPSRVRFRLLDPNTRLLPSAGDQDISLTKAGFSSLDLPPSKVFVTENEINFLAFPEVADAMVIFGAGYGFENLAAAPW
ncbi:MAG: DUF3322 domain-containing protein, partial [Xanthomonadales bacterium]|nr:DUF3322 domain-containing protein [Xanthomonadales bacterium]